MTNLEESSCPPRIRTSCPPVNSAEEPRISCFKNQSLPVVCSSFYRFSIDDEKDILEAEEELNAALKSEATMSSDMSLRTAPRVAATSKDLPIPFSSSSWEVYNMLDPGHRGLIGDFSKGAINLPMEQDLEDFLLKKPLVSSGNKRIIVVFHCEFSSERAPHM
ncbi:hypothetical protein E2320_001458 [Naja naja]|nr:hypothetical protein E2320_001458 [Naja naja]